MESTANFDKAMQDIHKLLKSSLPDRQKELNILSEKHAKLKSLKAPRSAYATLSFDVSTSQYEE